MPRQDKLTIRSVLTGPRQHDKGTAPAKRSYHAGYYAAFLLDPDQSNVEAVFHGAAKRLAPAVKVSF